MAVTIIAQDFQEDFVSSGTAQFFALSLGPGAADRVIAIVLQCDQLAPGSATINTGGGPVALNATTTAHVTTDTGEGNIQLYTRIYYKLTPSGSGADVVINFTGSGPDVQIGVYRILGAGPSITNSGIDTSDNTVSDPLTTGSLVIPANAGWLGGTINPFASSAWANATEDIDTSSSNFQFSNAIRTTAGTVTITDSMGGNPFGSALVWAMFGIGGTTQNAQANLTGAGALTANASVIRNATAMLGGAGQLLATSGQQLANATLQGVGSLTAIASQKLGIAATLGGSGSLIVDTLIARGARATLGGQGGIVADGTRIFTPPPPDLSLHAGEWPLILPQCPILNGFSEQRQRNAIEFQPDVGFTKLHRRATASVMQASLIYRMTDDQVAKFNEWYVDYQADGTLSFTWAHPVTKVSYSWMFDAQDAPKIDRATPNTFRVAFNLLRLE